MKSNKCNETYRIQALEEFHLIGIITRLGSWKRKEIPIHTVHDLGQSRISKCGQIDQGIQINVDKESVRVSIFQSSKEQIEVYHTIHRKFKNHHIERLIGIKLLAAIAIVVQHGIDTSGRIV